jgi:gliding motility-associated-like protein
MRNFPSCRNENFFSSVLICLFVCTACTSYAQTNEGNDFWCGFLRHRDYGQDAMAVIITSKTNTSGTVRIPLQNWQKPFTVAANSVTVVQMPGIAENALSEYIEQRGIQVVSDDPVSVYIHQYHAMRSEATVVLPVFSLGTEYYALTYKGLQDQGMVYPSEFLLVGAVDSTHINVTVSDQTKGGHAAGSTFQIILNAGETYQVQAAAGTGDMSGSHITGDKKFSVLAGASWTQVPTGCDFRDNLLEQMYPVSTWGKQFVSAPFAHMSYDLFRVLASEDNTVVTVKGQTTQQFTIQAGKYVEFKSSEANFITASHPVMVAQFLIGSACSGYGPQGDPSILILNSLEQIRDTVTLYNSRFEAITENYINLVMKTSDVPATQFDGQLLTSIATVQTVPANPVYSYTQVKVNEGAHTIASSGCGVIASAYGYGNVESYAYGGGANFTPLSAKSLIPPGGCLHDTIEFDTHLNGPRYTFKWDLGDGATSDKNKFNHYYAALGTYKVVLELTDNCLNMTDTLTRDLRITLRQAAAVSGDTAVCTGSEIDLRAVDLPGADYTWTGPNQFFSNLQFPMLLHTTILDSGPYVVVGTISGCASYPATATVTVHPNPVPDLGRDTVACPEGGNPLAVLTPGTYKAYRWSDYSTSPELSVYTGGNYGVTVEDNNGCSGSDSVSVKSQCPTKYYIPNVFSPNDDGIDDEFRILGSDIISLRLTIYDRWGDEVFEGNGPDTYWDGKFRGRPVGMGVYVWMARIEGYRKDGSTYSTTESGSVTVIR